jgi:hypothetical protein
MSSSSSSLSFPSIKNYEISQDRKTREQHLRNAYIIHGFEKLKDILNHTAGSNDIIRQDIDFINREKFNNTSRK